jgi:hypothetical protein
MSKAKYGYLAAIIDGEGCLSIGAGRRQKWGVINYNPIVSVANTDVRLIDWLVANFGGNFFIQKQQTPRNKQAYVWRLLAKREIELLLLAVMPYLIVKDERAKILLEFVRLPRMADPNKRKELFDKLTVLNRRGIGVEANTSSTSSDVKIGSELQGDLQSVPPVTEEAE